MKKIFKFVKQNVPAIAVSGILAASFIAPEMALAGDGGADAFGDIWDTLKSWTEGVLGRIIAGAMILVGIIGGIARQSLMAFAIGIGGGMGLFNAPAVVESIVGSTLEHADKVAPTLIQISNGLGG